MKATNENASRRDLKRGQELFEDISRDVEVIKSQLCKIQSAIICRDIRHFAGITGMGGRKGQDEKFAIQYDSYIDGSLKDCTKEDCDYIICYSNIDASFRKVKNFLDSDFDHEKYKLQYLEWKIRD